MRVVREYNEIIDALSAEERKLFAQHLKNLDRKIGPGLQKYTWTSPGIKEYFVRDACRECSKVYDIVKQYKSNDMKIVEACAAMERKLLIRIEKKVVYRASEFKQMQASYKAHVEGYLSQHHQRITELLMRTYQFFE
ncbi:hypothetical protein FOZ62_017633, partial [Perkinsus olseni]